MFCRRSIKEIFAKKYAGQLKITEECIEVCNSLNEAAEETIKKLQLSIVDFNSRMLALGVKINEEEGIKIAQEEDEVHEGEVHEVKSIKLLVHEGEVHEGEVHEGEVKRKLLLQAIKYTDIRIFLTVEEITQYVNKNQTIFNKIKSIASYLQTDIDNLKATELTEETKELGIKTIEKTRNAVINLIDSFKMNMKNRKDIMEVISELQNSLSKYNNETLPELLDKLYE